MTSSGKINPARAEILHLRARVVVAERMATAALELALRIRPEELNAGIEIARRRLAEAYEDPNFAPDLAGQAERDFLAEEVERLMRGLQSELGFKGGIAADEQG